VGALANPFYEIPCSFRESHARLLLIGRLFTTARELANLPTEGAGSLQVAYKYFHELWLGQARPQSEPPEDLKADVAESFFYLVDNSPSAAYELRLKLRDWLNGCGALDAQTACACLQALRQCLPAVLHPGAALEADCDMRWAILMLSLVELAQPELAEVA
jgi:hypothetical protein